MELSKRQMFFYSYFSIDNFFNIILKMIGFLLCLDTFML